MEKYPLRYDANPFSHDLSGNPIEFAHFSPVIKRNQKSISSDKAKSGKDFSNSSAKKLDPPSGFEGVEFNLSD